MKHQPLVSEADVVQKTLVALIVQCQADGMDDVTKAINHFSALMEDQNAKLNAVLEYVSELKNSSGLISLDLSGRGVILKERTRRPRKYATTASWISLRLIAMFILLSVFLIVSVF